MGNSGSVSLTTQDSSKQSKPSFRETVFKHRRSLTHNGTKSSRGTSTGRGKEPSSDRPWRASSKQEKETSKINGAAAAAQTGNVSSIGRTVTNPVNIVQPKDTAAPWEAADKVQPSSSLAEPTYEEIIQGTGEANDSAAAKGPHTQAASALTSADRAGDANAVTASTASAARPTDQRGSSCSEPPTDHASHAKSTEQADESQSTGLSSNKFVAFFRGGMGKKSKRPKSTARAEESHQVSADFVGLVITAPSRGRDSGCVSDSERDRSKDAHGHRRAASYDRQLPEIPGVRIDSDETLPKQRYSAENSPKHRRALPELPQEVLLDPSRPGEAAANRVYSMLVANPPSNLGEMGNTNANDDDSYDHIQRIRNPLSVKIMKVKARDGRSDIDDGYSIGVGQSNIPANHHAGCDTDSAHTEALAAVQAPLNHDNPLDDPGLHSLCKGSIQTANLLSPHKQTSVAYATLADVDGSLLTGEVWPAGKPISSPAGNHAIPPYSIVKPVTARSLDRRPEHTESLDAAKVSGPSVPDKLFNLTEDVAACSESSWATMRCSVSQEPPSQVIVEDESEVYSEPIELSASGAHISYTHGDVPDDYDILTVRPPLSTIQVRLADVNRRESAIEEDDYYETVDKADLPSSDLSLHDWTHAAPDVSYSSPIENDADSVYANPKDVECAPRPRAVGRPQRSGYEEIVLPSTASVASAVEVTRPRGQGEQQTGNETAAKPAAGVDSAKEAHSGVGTASLGVGVASLHDLKKASRRGGYEEVDLLQPSVELAQLRQPQAAALAAESPSAAAGSTAMIIPPSPSERPLGALLSTRCRLPHAYEEIQDQPQQSSQSVVKARPQHHYDEIHDFTG